MQNSTWITHTHKKGHHIRNPQCHARQLCLDTYMLKSDHGYLSNHMWWRLTMLRRPWQCKLALIIPDGRNGGRAAGSASKHLCVRKTISRDDGNTNTCLVVYVSVCFVVVSAIVPILLFVLALINRGLINRFSIDRAYQQASINRSPINRPLLIWPLLICLY